MNKLLIAFGAFLLLAGIGACIAGSWAISTNNSLISKEEAVNSAYSQVQNVYQRRMDLIPNLVEVVKGYATHEKDTLVGVAQARNTAAKIQLPANPTAAQLKVYQDAQTGLGNALSRLMVVVEKYPELKANEGYMNLQSQLEGTENRIAVERKKLNSIVQDYNTSLRVFPSSFVASFRGLTPKAYFEAEKGSNVAPKVKF